VLADEARLRREGRRKLVALRLGADHRLELLAAGPVQLPVDHQDSLRILERPLRFFERLGARRFADVEAARVLTEAQIMFNREQVLLFVETRHEARGAARREAEDLQFWCADRHLP